MLDSKDCTVHRGTFCQFPFRWIHDCHSSNTTGTICVSKAYLKAKIKPSLVCCVPKMAYFCFIMQKAGHFSISNIDRREKKSGAFPSSPYQISLFRLMVFKQHENYRLLILKMSFSYNILPKLIFDTAIHTLIIISAKTFMLKWQTKEAL